MTVLRERREEPSRPLYRFACCGSARAVVEVDEGGFYKKMDMPSPHAEARERIDLTGLYAASQLAVPPKRNMQFLL